MMAVGLLVQRPLDRAMRRLQAESAARHGVLVKLLWVSTIRATGAEARMQTAWERSVAATARTGEDVHFWASFALTSANSARIHNPFHDRDRSHAHHRGQPVRGGARCLTMLAGRVFAPVAGIAAVITRSDADLHSPQGDQSNHGAEDERPPGRTFVARRIQRGGITFDNVTFSYPAGVETALEKINFKISAGERIRDHGPSRIWKDELFGTLYWPVVLSPQKAASRSTALT